MIPHLTITKRLWLLSTSIITISILCFYFYYNATGEKQLKESYKKECLGLVQTISVNLGSALYFQDNDFLEKMLTGLKNDPDLLFIYITNKDQENSYQYKSDKYLSEINTIIDSRSIYEYSENALLVKHSVFFRDNFQGDLVIGFNLNWIRLKIKEQDRYLIIISGSLALVLFLISGIIAKIISKPIKNAANIISDYSDREGSLNLRLPEKGPKEVLQLVKSINKLSDNLDSNILKLNKSKENLETLFQLSPVALVIADTLGNIEKVNESACKFFGVNHDELVQLNLDVFFVSDDLNTIYNQIIQDAEDVRDFVTTLKMKDGAKKVVEINVASQQDELNYVKSIIIALIDITEKIEIQREILQNQTDLQRINMELTQKTEELKSLSNINQINAQNLEQLINISHQMMRDLDFSKIMHTLAEPIVYYPVIWLLD